MDPLQSLDQVLLTQIHGFGVFSTKPGKVYVTKYVETMVHGNHHYVSFFCQSAAFLGGKENCRTRVIASAVEPYEHRPFLAVQGRCPDIEFLAFLGHLLVLEFKSEVVVGRLAAPSHILALHCLGAIRLSLEHIVPSGRVRRRHEAFRLSIRHSLESVDTCIVVPHNTAVGGLDNAVLPRGEGAFDVAFLFACTAA